MKRLKKKVGGCDNVLDEREKEMRKRKA